MKLCITIKCIYLHIFVFCDFNDYNLLIGIHYTMKTLFIKNYREPMSYSGYTRLNSISILHFY